MSNRLLNILSIGLLSISLVGSIGYNAIDKKSKQESTTELKNKVAELEKRKEELVASETSFKQGIGKAQDEINKIDASIDMFKNYDKTIESYNKEISQLKKDMSYILNLEVTKPKSNYDQEQINYLEGNKERASIIAGYLPIPLLDTLIESTGSDTNSAVYEVIADTNKFVTNYISEPIIKLNAYVKSLKGRIEDLDNIINLKNPTADQKVENIAKLMKITKDSSLVDYIKGSEYNNVGYYIDELLLKYPLVVEMYQWLLIDGEAKMLYLNDVSSNIMSLTQANTGVEWTEEQRLSQEEKNKMSSEILEKHADMIDELLSINAKSLNVTKDTVSVTKGLLKWRKSDIYVKNKDGYMPYVVKVVESNKRPNESVEIYYTSQLNPFLIRLGFDDNNTVYLGIDAYHTSKGTEPLGIELFEYFSRAQKLGYAHLDGSYKDVYNENCIYPIDMED